MIGWSVLRSKLRRETDAEAHSTVVPCEPRPVSKDQRTLLGAVLAAHVVEQSFLAACYAVPAPPGVLKFRTDGLVQRVEARVCSSHSRMAPASCSTEMAQPRSVRIADRRSFVISIGSSPAWMNPRTPLFVPGRCHRSGFENVAAAGSPTRASCPRRRTNATFLACERRCRFAGLHLGRAKRRPETLPANWCARTS